MVTKLCLCPSNCSYPSVVDGWNSFTLVSLASVGICMRKPLMWICQQFWRIFLSSWNIYDSIPQKISITDEFTLSFYQPSGSSFLASEGKETKTVSFYFSCLLRLWWGREVSNNCHWTRTYSASIWKAQRTGTMFDHYLNSRPWMINEIFCMAYKRW